MSIFGLFTNTSYFKGTASGSSIYKFIRSKKSKNDWLAQRPTTELPPKPETKTLKLRAPKDKPCKSRKLGYKEQRDMEALPRTIDELETEQKQLFAAMSDHAFYKKDKDEIAAINARLQVVEVEITAAYLRWEELDAIAEGWE